MTPPKANYKIDDLALHTVVMEQAINIFTEVFNETLRGTEGVTGERLSEVMTAVFDIAAKTIKNKGRKTELGAAFNKKDVEKYKQDIREGREHKKLMDLLRKRVTRVIKQGLLEAGGATGHTAMGIHTVTQFYNDPKQLSMFSDEIIESYSRATGLQLTDRPNSFGVVLNQAQRRVFEGILKAFSQTNYRGSRQIRKEEDLKERGIKTDSQTALRAIENAYKNIDRVPVVKLTQAELIRLAGYGTRHEDKNDTMEALGFLTTKQFCFFWERPKRDERGRFVKDKAGNWAKEEVMEVGTLFRVAVVREDGVLKYYEISPSSVILDQVNSHYGGKYFLLIPNDWREEVKKLTGKRGSNYTYEFVFWLRLQFEYIRRYNSTHKDKKPFVIKKTWEEIAITLKMPESMYRANKKRAAKIIEDAYHTATKLGYLTKVDSLGAADILYLNESFYPKPGELV